MERAARLCHTPPHTPSQRPPTHRQINKILVDLTSMGEKHGIRFPREFGLLIKQLLYFDRYTRILVREMGADSAPLHALHVYGGRPCKDPGRLWRTGR